MIPTASSTTPRCTTMPPLARPTRPAPPPDVPGARRAHRQHEGAGRPWRPPWRRGRSRRAWPMPRRPNATHTTTVSTPIHAGMARRCHSTAAAHLAPAEHGRHRHQEEQGQADRDGHRVEEGRADRHLLLGDRLVEQREDGAEQDDEGEADEQHVVEEEGALPTERRVDAARRAQPVAAPGDETEADDDHGEEEADQQRPERRTPRTRAPMRSRRSG